ncbi:hypothetical protein EJ06DRAFT_89623 [Trichodelitschia bisporula]|uniref:Uncharacterized protein n=1 Tax=Trichodelitschia bisporula TaxID=703511 RepID=A0A6G1HRU6_9PEZI|nr:hypothetical protein EJ06DRAFT_89623 [Trichodelitschia bisporula]
MVGESGMCRGFAKFARGVAGRMETSGRCAMVRIKGALRTDARRFHSDCLQEIVSWSSDSWSRTSCCPSAPSTRPYLLRRGEVHAVYAFHPVSTPCPKARAFADIRTIRTSNLHGSPHSTQSLNRVLSSSQIFHRYPLGNCLSQGKCPSSFPRTEQPSFRSLTASLRVRYIQRPLDI